MEVTTEAGKSFVVSITSVDDEVIGTINNLVFADLRFGQPANAYELKNTLHTGDNYLMLLCINKAGPWEIGFSITIDGVARPDLNKNVIGQEGDGLTYVFALTIKI